MSEPITAEIETLARMWVICDPNRDKDSIDDPQPLHVDGERVMRPRWHWFIPRAEATLDYLKANGLKLAPADA